MKNIIIILTFSMLLLFTGCGSNDRLESIEASGTIESKNITVSSRTAGNIETINFIEGSEVNAGDTIIIIDHELLEIQLQQAIAGKDAVEAQLNLMLAGAREEDINQAEQNLKQARANLNKAIAGVELLKKNIRDSYVTAPISGFIVKTFVERGESATPMSSLFKFSNLDVVELVIYVSTKELAYVKPGQEADVTIDAFKDKVYKGKATYISPEAEFTPKNIQTKDERTKLVFAVKISIPNNDYDLKAGMPADASIITKFQD